MGAVFSSLPCLQSRGPAPGRQRAADQRDQAVERYYCSAPKERSPLFLSFGVSGKRLRHRSRSGDQTPGSIHGDRSETPAVFLRERSALSVGKVPVPDGLSQQHRGRGGVSEQLSIHIFLAVGQIEGLHILAP